MHCCWVLKLIDTKLKCNCEEILEEKKIENHPEQSKE